MTFVTVDVDDADHVVFARALAFKQRPVVATCLIRAPCRPPAVRAASRGRRSAPGATLRGPRRCPRRLAIVVGHQARRFVDPDGARGVSRSSWGITRNASWPRRCARGGSVNEKHHCDRRTAACNTIVVSGIFARDGGPSPTAILRDRRHAPRVRLVPSPPRDSSPDEEHYCNHQESYETTQERSLDPGSDLVVQRRPTDCPRPYSADGPEQHSAPCAQSEDRTEPVHASGNFWVGLRQPCQEHAERDPDKKPAGNHREEAGPQSHNRQGWTVRQGSMRCGTPI